MPKIKNIASDINESDADADNTINAVQMAEHVALNTLDAEAVVMGYESWDDIINHLPPANSTFEFDGHSATFGDLPFNSILYLLQYGFNQCLQDRSMASERDAAMRKKEYISEDECRDRLHAYRAQKVRNLLDGILYAKRASGPRADTFQKTVNLVIKEALTKLCADKRSALPKGDAYDDYARRYLAKFQDTVYAEAQRRIDMPIMVDGLDDLF